MASEIKQRLLTAAIGVFARKGYGSTTIAEICDAAEANIAAVNYCSVKLELSDDCWGKTFLAALRKGQG